VAGYLALQPPPEVALTDAGDRDRFRARVKVREIDGMSTAELAELLGRTPAAIRQSRHRARARVATAGASS
jgi:DNA-directed RNA polymerase specialized sigma24 family protein